MAAVKRNAILTCICMVTIVLMVSSGFPISDLASASDTLQNNGNDEIQFNDNIGTIISDGSLFDEFSYNTQTSHSISFPELQSFGYGTTYLQTSDHYLHSLPQKQRTLISDTDTPVISSSLANLLQNSTSDDLIRVIVTLREQPQFENFQQIKEQSRQRISNLEQTQSCDTFEFLEAVDYETFQMRKELYNNANVAIAESQAILIQKIVTLNGSVLHRYSFTNSIAAQLTPEALTILESDSSIKSIVLDELQHILLDHSVPSIYADDWHSYGYDGAPWDVAILDTGVDQTHPALSSRVIDAKNFATGATTHDDEHGHGTHVAGTVASTQSGTPGVAPGASIINAKIGNPSAYDSDVIAGAEWAVTGAIDDAEIINHSYGVGVSKGQFIDAFVYYYDIVWVGAAGNDGPDSGTVADVGYNMITVGNMNDQNTDSRADDTIRSSSSRGPTWDGRIKPDLVAPGTNIIAPAHDWEGGLLGLNPDYVSMTGTSMASPHIAGTVALLYDYRGDILDPKYYKTLLMQNSDDWGVAGPDNTYGWGYVNMQTAYSQRANILTDSIGDGESVWYKVYLNAGNSFKATMVFERHGTYDSSDNSWDLDPVSDLDIYMYAPDDSYVDYSLSSVNNVEQIETSSVPVTGWYRIRVHGYDVDASVGTDEYCLASSTAITRAYYPVVTDVSVNAVSVSPGGYDGTYNRTEWFNIEVSVQDTDSAPADITVTMEVYRPDSTYATTHTLPYNISSGVWENSWNFGQTSQAGDWYQIVVAEDVTGMTSSNYTFYFTCQNENPVIQSISLSSLTPRRVNETLDITVYATDYHNGTDLFVYFQFWMANGSSYVYEMYQNPISNLFYYNLTLEESDPLGFWDYYIWVSDNQGGWTNSELNQFEVLTHQYVLTISSPFGTTIGSGLYDAGATAYAGLDTNVIPVIVGEQLAFQSWTGDASGTDYSQSDLIIMNAPKTVVALWATEYYLTVISSHGTPSGEGWYVAGTTAYAGLDADIMDGVAGERFVFQSWDDDASGTDYLQSDSILMDTPKTATVLWNTEYYLSVVSPYGNPSGEGWYVNGTIVYVGFDSDIVGGVSGERFVFQSWTGDATGIDYSQSDDIAMDSPKTATAVWDTEYYLTVTTAHGTPSGEGWYAADSTVYAALDLDIVAGDTGERFVFSSWTDDASGTDYSQSTDITMDAPKTATAVWDTEYYLTVTTAHGTPSGEGWYAAGSTANASLDVTLISGVTGERFVFNSWTDDASGTDYSQSADITMDGPKTATAVWDTEYYLTVTTDHSTPSGEGWYVSGTTAYAGLDTDIVAGVTGERFVLQSWTDDGSGTDYSQSDAIIMDGARTATAVWQTQYQLTCTTNPIGLSPLPTITPAGAWFNDGLIVILAAEEVAGYTFEHWLVDDVESDAGVESISLVMDEVHDAIAHYQVIDTTTTTTDTTTTTTGTILPPDGTMMLVIIGAGGVGVVIVILLIVMKKKS